MRKLSFLPILLVLVLGCAQLGVPAPQTFNEKAAAALITVTGARETTLTLLQAGKISADDAQNIQSQADTLRQGIEVARSIRAMTPDVADDRLAATITALNALTAYLEARKQ
jgi:hypothetical protein